MEDLLPGFQRMMRSSAPGHAVDQSETFERLPEVLAIGLVGEIALLVAARRKSWTLAEVISACRITQPVLDHKDDGADDPTMVDPRDPMREREIPFNPTHLNA
jgi:hypothetical protein